LGILGCSAANSLIIQGGNRRNLCCGAEFRGNDSTRRGLLLAALTLVNNNEINKRTSTAARNRDQVSFASDLIHGVPKFCRHSS